uniref:GATOR complex protein NPRL3 n=1 Tax=Panstrongylus megistus TaxID=65343 RepID=A0A069DUL5_9HEMI
MDADPLSVILVKSDSKGDRLLFRFPYSAHEGQENGKQQHRKNPYALTVSESIQGDPPIQKLNRTNGYLANFPDEVLSNLFAVKPELCESKFELKVNNVRFVGHPSLVQPCVKRGKSPNKPIILLNIVFALQASASHSIVKCYYELSKRLGTALKQEEKRCGYVNHQVKIMISAHDDCGRSDESDGDGVDPFEMILEQSSLASDLKNIYTDLCTSGLVQIRINRTLPMSFCLPQKVHQLQNKDLMVDPETIEKCLKKVRPYHGLLLLVEPCKLLETLIADTSNELIKLVKIYTPLKSLHTLSQDARLKLSVVFRLAGDLVYWGKAIIIYPLCESNVYTTTPNASVHANSQLVEQFAQHFPSYSLLKVLSEFSLPISVSQRISPFSDTAHNDIQIIIWLLQHRLLLQLHTYVYYMPTNRGMIVQEGDSCESSGGDSETTSESDTSDECLPQENDATLRDEILSKLSNDEGAAILSAPANVLEKRLLLRLIQQGYLKGEHHLEEIMYSENITRSQLLQLLDKFRDVLVICEAEDPALAMFYPHSSL